jgi:hypothetical protein
LEPTNRLWALTLFEPMAWSELSAAGVAPHPRNDHAAVYAARRMAMHVVGGVGTGADEAWRLALSGAPTWSQYALQGTRPRARTGASLIVDGARHRVIAFGGRAGDWTLADVWTHSLDGPGPWTPLYAGGPRPPLSSHRAVFDSVGARMIVVGGNDENGRPSNGVWALSLAGTPRWSRMPYCGTNSRMSGNVAADVDVMRRRVLVWVGVDSLGAPVSELWALSLGGFGTWTRLIADGEEPRARWATLNYDAGHDRVVINGPVRFTSDPPDFWSLPLGSGTWTHIAAAPDGPSFPDPPTGHSDRNADRVLAYAGGPTFALGLSGPPTWRALDSESSNLPPLRLGAATAFDPVGNRLIVAFGSDVNMPFGGDVNACWAFAFPNNLYSLHAGAVPRLGGDVTMRPEAVCHASGDAVQLFAIPSRGNKFSRWSGDASSFLNPVTITMDSAKNIDAVFLPNCEATLDVRDAECRRLDHALAGGRLYGPGTIVTLAAVPAPGYAFDHWTGDASGTTSPTTTTMDRSRAISAAFHSTNASNALTEIAIVAPNPAATVRVIHAAGGAGRAVERVGRDGPRGRRTGRRRASRGPLHRDVDRE